MSLEDLKPRLNFLAQAFSGALVLLGWSLGFYLILSAWTYPFELEARESTEWLYVLADRAGISIYDHVRVAFLNMNHGPVDPIWKMVVARVFPFLESWQVLRFSVFLYPLVLLLVTLRTANQDEGTKTQKLIRAGSWGLLLLMTLQLIQHSVFRTGRSDTTVLCWLFAALSFGIGERLDRVRACTVGFFSGLAVLTNWRYGPVAIALPLLAYGWSFRAGLAALTGALFPFGAILSMVFQGDIHKYYAHFFAFFGAGAHGSGRLARWEWIPYGIEASLRYSRWIWVMILGGGVFLLRSERRTLVWNTVLLSGVWAVCAATYYLNGAGGGIYYFAPLFLALWVFGIRHLRGVLSPDRESLVLALGLCVLMVSVQREGVWRQAQDLWSTRDPAMELTRKLRTLDAQGGVYTEDLYLFKQRYTGEIIDMGDTCYEVASKTPSPYGVQFDQTLSRYFTHRRDAGYPEYVFRGLLPSEVLKIKTVTYQKIAETPLMFPMNGHGSGILYRRKDIQP